MPNKFYRFIFLKGYYKKLNLKDKNDEGKREIAGLWGSLEERHRIYKNKIICFNFASV